MSSGAEGSDASELARFLLGDAHAAPSLEALEAFGLLGHAYATLPRHPRREELRQGFRIIATRHLAVRTALRHLLQVWEDVNVRPVVFKGFALAEFVYPSAGQRTYADVDLVIEASQAPMVFGRARDAGWQVVWRAGATEDLLALHGAEYTGHELGQLRHPNLAVSVDLHRRVVHNSHNRLAPHASAERLTAAFRHGANEVLWEGVTFRVASPVDSVVFGLALNRCWGSDAWRVKPRDYADFQALAQRYGVTPSAVLERATELGVARTVGLFLDRCDVSRGHLDLRPPSWWRRRAWNLAVAPERGPRDALVAAMHVADGFVDAAAVLTALPSAWTAVRCTRSGRPPSVDAPASVDGRSPTDPLGRGALDPWRWRTLRRGAHRALRILGVDGELRERALVLAAHDILRRHGCDVAVASPSDPLDGERWTLTLDGREVPLGASEDRPRYAEPGSLTSMPGTG
jgi:hypothetical protein